MEARPRGRFGVLPGHGPRFRRSGRSWDRPSHGRSLSSGIAEVRPERGTAVWSPSRGAACVFLASHYAGALTGDTIYIDGGYHILGCERQGMTAAVQAPLIGVINA